MTTSNAAERFHRSLRTLCRRMRVAFALRLAFFVTVGKRFTGQPIFVNQEPRASELSCGLAIVLPGIEAAGPFPQAICQGIRNSPWRGAVEIFYWGIPFPEGYFPNVIWLKRNQYQAAGLAQKIQDYQKAYPGRPVHLFGNSAGAGIALLAVERLPITSPIDSLVFLQGAVSPNHDLTIALDRVKKGILNCCSHRDWMVLALGTFIFGTIDRRHCVAAGCRGFHIPTQPEKRRLYMEKLVQKKWVPEWIDLYDHWGSHGSSTSHKFISQLVMPWLLHDTAPVPPAN